MQRDRVVRVLSALVLVSLAGCILPVATDATVLVLEYDLTPPPGGTDTVASPGHHCGTASIDRDVMTVQRSAYDRANGTGRFLYVDPELTERVPTIGTEPFVMGFPAEVRAGIEGIQASWTVIDVDGRGVVRVDGAAVSLPYTWEVQQEGWRIEAQLREGPSRVKVIADQMCM